ncbi:MAG: hypothetical protein JXR19_06690 [Bacteroidia bacterium]
MTNELSKFRQFHVFDQQFVQNQALANLQETTDYAVVGSFRATEEDIRVNVQLTEPDTGRLIWGERFQSQIDGIFELQEDVLRKLVSSFQSKVDQNLLSRIQNKPNQDHRAYAFWLKGMEAIKRKSNDMESIRELFYKSLEIDPNYSLAHSGISMTYHNEWSCHLWTNWEESSELAKKHARKAVNLDPDNALAHLILGRSFLYDGEFEKAEMNFRRVISLNPNDAYNLIAVAFWTTYLGDIERSKELYYKAISLNPILESKYSTYALQIFFEAGDFEKALVFANETDESSQWADFSVFMGACYFYLGEKEKAIVLWRRFIEYFRVTIYNGKANLQEQALEWQKGVNPYKGKTNLQPYWEFVSKEESFKIPIKQNTDSQIIAYIEDLDSAFRFEYNSKEITINKSKGLTDISFLLSNPNLNFPSEELLGVAVKQTGVNLIDRKSVLNYRERLKVLIKEIEECKVEGDFKQLDILEDEYDKLVEFLSSSLGLGGRIRKGNSSLEKSRTAITWRIRNAIKKISMLHPELGNHLQRSIKTGYRCGYFPEIKLNWIVT